MTDWDQVVELRPEERLAIYQQYLKESPRDPAIWFDLGLAFKRLRRWQECADANLHALEMTAEPEDPAWWNLGIAATALRNWTLARKAWRGYGLDMPDGDGPIELDYGMTPIRLGEEEVVWAKRIDPARASILNVPLSDDFRWGDIVLHDGVPNGQREVNGRRYPVFDALERWSASEIPTLTAKVRCGDDGAAQALVQLFESSGFAAEDWTGSVRNLCKACSEGLPTGHNHPFGRDSAVRDFGIASPMGLARRLLDEWRMANPLKRAYDELQLAGNAEVG